jgi:hypothetical protein
MTGPTLMREAMTEPFPTEQLNFRLTATSLSQRLALDDDPSAFAFHLPFEVRQGDLLVARIHALLIRVANAERWDFSPAEVFDSIDQDVHELYCAIYDQQRETLRGDLVEPTDFRDVLYIDSVKVIPNRRHQRLALKAVELLRDMFGEGCAVLALRAHPIDPKSPKYQEAFDREVFSQPFEAHGDAAKTKLRDYWSQLGFERVDDTDFMVFDMSDERPKLSEPPSR